MDFQKDQVDELRRIAPDLSIAQEGAIPYILIKGLHLPDDCKPSSIDALLCPVARDGYESTLFYAQQITGCPARNWNRANVRILDKNWFAVSWKVKNGLRLAEMVQVHLDALRNENA